MTKVTYMARDGIWEGEMIKAGDFWSDIKDRFGNVIQVENFHIIS